MVTASFVECLIAVEIPIDENCQNCQMLKFDFWWDGSLQKRDPQTPCVPTSWLEDFVLGSWISESDPNLLQNETFRTTHFHPFFYRNMFLGGSL